MLIANTELVIYASFLIAYFNCSILHYYLDLTFFFKDNLEITEFDLHLKSTMKELSQTQTSTT